jgi:hypothetical protein
MAEEQARSRVKVACTVAGHTDDWITFDCSQWGLVEFELLMGRYDLVDGLRYVKRDSVNWHIKGDKGVVPHPGRGANAQQWRAVYQAIGPQTGIELANWLANAPAMAMLEVVRLQPKSAAGDAGSGDGEGDDASS